jgi:hypothetical protein
LETRETPKSQQGWISDHQTATPHQFQNGYFAALREIVIAAQQLSQKNRGDSQDGVKKTSEIIIEEKLGAEVHLVTSAGTQSGITCSPEPFWTG